MAFPNPYKFLDGEEWDGSLRNHLHTLEKPGDVRRALVGTSTVGDVVAKPLTYWAVACGLVKLGWVNHSDPELAEVLAEMKLDKRASAKDKLKKLMPHRVELMEKRGLWRQIQTMTAAEFAEACDGAYFAHTEVLGETAEDGTNLHAACERYIKGCMEGHGDITLSIEELERIKPFIEWSKQHVSKFLWSEMHAYSEKLWTGCISDAGYVGVDGKIAVMEFKRAKGAFDNHFWQVGGQHLAIEENGGFDRDGNKVFELPGPIERHVVFPFGETKPTGHVYDAETAKNEGEWFHPLTNCRTFKAELYIYKVKNFLPLAGFRQETVTQS